jgi:hypothetical protein
MKKPISLEDAARTLLGRERDDNEQETSNRGARPPSKITLPTVKWMEKPGPEWEAPQKPPKLVRKRGKA